MGGGQLRLFLSDLQRFPGRGREDDDMEYSEGFRARMVQKMLEPAAMSASRAGSRREGCQERIHRLSQQPASAETGGASRNGRFDLMAGTGPGIIWWS